jgi:hypothetical protein
MKLFPADTVNIKTQFANRFDEKKEKQIAVKCVRKKRRKINGKEQSKRGKGKFTLIESVAPSGCPVTRKTTLLYQYVYVQYTEIFTVCGQVKVFLVRESFAQNRNIWIECLVA